MSCGDDSRHDRERHKCDGSRSGRANAWSAIAALATRTPVQTFLLCPLAVIAFEFAWQGGRPDDRAWWGLPLMAWGYLQYKLVGRLSRCRAPAAAAGMETARAHPRPRALSLHAQPDVSRAPHLPGRARDHLLVVVRAHPAGRRARSGSSAACSHDEARLQAAFGADYDAYRARVKRWIPYVIVTRLARITGSPSSHSPR